MPEGDTIFRSARALDRALAGRTVTRTDMLVPGRSVRIAYLQTEAGPLAVMVELIGAHRAAGGHRSQLSISSSALTR